eukprot:GILI01010617.1.p1 GENE.GILI01010617.1~~GILI01010617.1.p1  ORF type:complete len:633 (+),score=84.39 GILI01010617.1:224-1900(+)
MAAVVRPDRIAWCGNPFGDVPAASGPTDSTVYAIWHNDPRWVTVKADLHNSSLGLSVVSDHVLLGTPSALNTLMTKVLSEAVSKPRATADPSWSYIQSSPTLRQYRDAHIRPFPKHSYRVGSCREPVCAPGETGVHLRSYDCPNTQPDGEPIYSPFCNFEYRHAVLEVPKDTSLKGIATDDVMNGAWKIRDAPLMRNVTEDILNNVFANPSASEIDPGWGGVSDLCPNGKLAVVSMMGGYSMTKVQDFIGSFIHFADPNCTKLVVMLKGKKGIHKAAELYPNRVEVIDYEEGNPYTPVIFKDRPVIDQRYEVAKFWLEDHYKEYRYIMACDTRDYFFLGDPLEALVRRLRSSGYLGREFVGSVSESFALGSFSGYVSDFINQCAIDWLKPCGAHCYSHLTKMTYTNGDPYATVNSGNIVGTSVGLLHYYRFHVRMTVESKYGFDRAGGNDQGIFTFYTHGMIQEANYPHTVLIFPSSRAGFSANPMPFNRIARRLRKDGNGWDYAVKDCGGHFLASIHQSDRDGPIDSLLRSDQGIRVPWKNLIASGTFNQYFQIGEG